MQDPMAAQRRRLKEAVAVNPGAEGFAALAELHRRAGALGEAEAVARAGLEVEPDAWDGRLALALVLLDRGQGDEAHAELARVGADLVALHGIELAQEGVSETELDAAFDAAETSTEDLIDPNRVAEEALALVAPVPESAETGALVPTGAFATETMAGLLERQGDPEGAERIRSSLTPAPESAAVDSRADSRAHVIAELSRWLANAQQRRGERA